MTDARPAPVKHGTGAGLAFKEPSSKSPTERAHAEQTQVPPWPPRAATVCPPLTGRSCGRNSTLPWGAWRVGGRVEAYGARPTRQTVLPTSSATSSAPSAATATPTGRPRASPSGRESR